MTPSRHPVVFVGPSLRAAAAERLLPSAVFRPPARRGDLDRVDPDRTDEVILIDGVMVYEHPPSPSETYRLAERGVRVLGASSIGALRAVELRDHGVEGIGWVFKEFCSGRLTADDELLARLDPRTGMAETLFLINVRYAVACLTASGALDHSRAGRFVAAIASLHFERRTRLQAEDLAASVGIEPRTFAEIMNPRYDVKAIDAALALRDSRHAPVGATSGLSSVVR
jgi:hypothetical protein